MLFGDAHNGYAVAYVFAIEDPEARGGKREGRRWYAFLAVFEEEVEATGAWPWITKGFEQMARGLRELAASARKGSADSGTVRLESHREDIEQGSVFTQSISLEERTPSHIRLTRGSFGHPEGYTRRPRFGNPGGISSITPATAKSLAELIGLETVDLEIHASMGWIMSGLLGPAKDATTATATDIDKGVTLAEDERER